MTDTGLNWYKSSYSGNTNDACIEVADLPAVTKVRDSKLAESPVLSFGDTQWTAFLGFAKDQSV
ncbi:DUF397 domain-containing protein [Streptomyces sp. NPDC090112]|uniref:DUF397 domain-containing protein n=1 Tax=Streptomyces sp. NPDC090112 TaxID=3365949 RepID=UPI0037F1B331